MTATPCADLEGPFANCSRARRLKVDDKVYLKKRPECRELLEANNCPTYNRVYNGKNRNAAQLNYERILRGCLVDLCMSYDYGKDGMVSGKTPQACIDEMYDFGVETTAKDYEVLPMEVGSSVCVHPPGCCSLPRGRAQKSKCKGVTVLIDGVEKELKNETISMTLTKGDVIPQSITVLQKLNRNCCQGTNRVKAKVSFYTPLGVLVEVLKDPLATLSVNGTAVQYDPEMLGGGE